jgi:hypothetical protein
MLVIAYLKVLAQQSNGQSNENREILSQDNW